MLINLTHPHDCRCGLNQMFCHRRNAERWCNLPQPWRDGLERVAALDKIDSLTRELDELKQDVDALNRLGSDFQ